MKRLLSVILILALTLTSLCACAQKSPDSAKEALELELNKIKNPDKDSINESINNFVAGDPTIQELFKDFDMTLLYKNFDYKILKCEENGDKASATVRMKNLNFGDIMTDYASEILKYIMGIYSDDLSDEEYYSLTYKKTAEILEKLIKSGKYKTAETEVEITLTKKDGKWMLDNQLTADMVFTGLSSFSDLLNGEF